MKNKLLLLSLLIVFVPFLLSAEETKQDTDLFALKEQANKVLYKEVAKTLKVKALKNGQELADKNAENAVVVESVSYAGLEDFTSQQKTVISFSGTKVTPNLPLYIDFNVPEKIEKATTIDASGNWALLFPTNILPQGDHTAYLQVEVDGVRSDALAVANFNVSTANQISQKTWYFIFFVSFAIFILLLAIILQLRKNARDLEPGQLI